MPPAIPFVELPTLPFSRDAEALRSGARGHSALRSEDSALRSEDSALRSEDSALRSEDSALRSEDSALRSEESALRSEDSASRLNGNAFALGVVLASLLLWACGGNAHADDPSPEERAIAYLAREVPQWSAENKCFSCHNNGDAARALYTAQRLGYKVDPAATADTTDWLTRPADWKNNGGDGEFNDKTLAALQFAAALAAATKTDAVKSSKPLEAAAALAAKLQQPDGSWRIDGPDTIGAPATWGRTLLTAAARNVLHQADERRFRDELARTDRWLRTAKPETVLDAAAVLIGLGAATDKAAVNQQSRSLDLIQRGEAKGGGWGPYVNAPPEPFDTAVVLIALSRSPTVAETAALVRRGRRFLLSTQLPEGNWPETTRPAEATSYAQRLSTAGWATEALLLTAPRE